MANCENCISSPEFSDYVTGVHNAAKSGALRCHMAENFRGSCESGDLSSHLGDFIGIDICNSRMPPPTLRRLFQVALEQNGSGWKYFGSGHGVGVCEMAAYANGAKVRSCGLTPIDPYWVLKDEVLSSDCGSLWTYLRSKYDASSLPAYNFKDPSLSVLRDPEKGIFRQVVAPFLEQDIGNLSQAVSGLGDDYCVIADMFGGLNYGPRGLLRDLCGKLAQNGAGLVVGSFKKISSELPLGDGVFVSGGWENVSGSRCSTFLALRSGHPWYSRLKNGMKGSEMQGFYDPYGSDFSLHDRIFRALKN